MTSSSNLILTNAVPDSVATVTYQIIDNKKKTVKLTVAEGGSVSHPVNPADSPWAISALINGTDKGGGNSNTATQTISQPNAMINCTIDTLTCRLDVQASDVAGRGEPTSVLDHGSTWGEAGDPESEVLKDAKTLNFAMQPQKQTQWCWAAVSASVATYYGSDDFTQCDLATWAASTRGVANANCCKDGSSSDCNKPFTLDTALTHVGHLNAMTEGASTLPAVQGQIDGKHPLGVRVGWTGGGGHFLVIDGYDTTVADPKIALADPFYGPSVVVFNTFPAHYQGGAVWSHSYTTK